MLTALDHIKTDIRYNYREKMRDICLVHKKGGKDREFEILVKLLAVADRVRQKIAENRSFNIEKRFGGLHNGRLRQDIAYERWTIVRFRLHLYILDPQVCTLIAVSVRPSVHGQKVKMLINRTRWYILI